ncbi:pantetheine-phosphate adenylyltransferase [Specibacter cremeus]|uniref:pantetheine-phosphate adenylyltransferase n=1 Tax=Specibacter cremeus TaxID=1629051 RepID=UPI000F7B1470|nr:pantetheine-phosphate adenylyltransferase [Specibacter cremeus]
MRRAVCPGSFDPIHNGHLEVIARASGLFDEVIVAVSTNYAKKYRFTLAERLDMARTTLSALSGIIVEPMGDGLLSDFCHERGASAIVKGLRSSSDFDYELPMATMNRQLSGVETVFLPGESRYLHLSSTLIKEVANLGGDVNDYVPRAVFRRLRGGPDTHPTPVVPRK